MFVWGTKQQVKHQFVQGQVQEEGRRCVHVRWCRWGRGISLYAHFLIALGCKQNVNPGLQREAPVCKVPTHPGCSWLGLLLLFTAWRWCFEGKLQRKTSKREASDQAAVFDTFSVTLSLLHFCCLFQYQHEKMKLFWPENCQHQLFFSPCR